MATPTTRRRRLPRGSIDSEMILRGAFEVAERDGLEAMSMPSLAAHLNVGVTSLYWYFRSKEELLQQMFVRAAQSLDSRVSRPVDVDPADWRAHLFQVFEEIHAIFAEDDVLAELLLHRNAGHSGQPLEGAYSGVESELALLTSAGFTLETAWQVYSTLWMFTHGMATNERARRRSSYPPPSSEQVAFLDASATPLLSRLVSNGASVDMTDLTGHSFAAGLNLILDAADVKLNPAVSAHERP